MLLNPQNCPCSSLSLFLLGVKNFRVLKFVDQKKIVFKTFLVYKILVLLVLMTRALTGPIFQGPNIDSFQVFQDPDIPNFSRFAMQKYVVLIK